MSLGLEFDVASWLERQGGTAAENATFGELVIRAGSTTLTEIDDRVARTVRPAVRVSILHLARWIAANWWRLRWEPEATANDWRLSHEIGGAGGGFLWPSLRFVTDGETISVSSRATSDGRSPIRYLTSADIVIPAADLERAFDDFLLCVTERLSATGFADDELIELWETVRAERQDPARSLLRRREALLGLDPEVQPEEAIDNLYERGDWMGDAALDEVFADARFGRVADYLHELKEDSVHPELELDLSSFESLSGAARREEIATALPWERGVLAARMARDHLNLDLEPIPGEMLHDLVHADVSLPRETTRGRHLAAGFTAPGGLRRVGAVLRRRHAFSRRFETARLIADALERPQGERILPITDRSTARQRYQRAFAQEFLCPIEAVRDMVSLPWPTSPELEDIAERFEVSEWTVRTVLVNRGLVSREYLPAA